MTKITAKTTTKTSTKTTSTSATVKPKTRPRATLRKDAKSAASETLADIMNAPTPVTAVDEVVSDDLTAIIPTTSADTATVSRPSKEVVELAIRSIKSDFNTAQRSFVNIACALRFLQNDNNFRAVLLPSETLTFEQFAHKTFGFKKSQTYALCNLADRFGVKKDDGTFAIADKYNEYGQTQLIAMSKLSDEQIADNIKPNMSVADIKKKSRELLGIPQQPKQSKTKKNISNTVTTTAGNSQALKVYATYDEFIADIDNIKTMIARVFKANPNYRISINYEWDKKVSSN